LVWEARKRGVPIEKLQEARDAETREELAKHHAAMAAAKAAKAQAQASAEAMEKAKTQAGSDQGITKDIKANQSESKGETPPSTAEAPNKPNARALAEPVNVSPVERGHSCPPNANQRDRTEDSQPPGQLDASADRNARAPGQAGSVGQNAIPQATNTTAPAPAQEKRLTDADLEKLIDQCECGWRGEVRAEECPRCHIKANMHERYCVCHKVWDYRRHSQQIGQYKRERAAMAKVLSP